MIIVVIEGYDGSGKTTLVRELITSLSGRGVRCVEVGRSAGNSSSHVAEMTGVIKRSDGGSNTLPPVADMFLRLARLYARIDLIAELDCEVVLLDRFLLYDLSRIPEETQICHSVLFERVAAALYVDLTIHLTSSFDILWNRVISRPAEDLSPKESRGYAHNFQGYQRFEQTLAVQSFYENVQAIDCGQRVGEVVGEALSLVGLASGIGRYR